MSDAFVALQWLRPHWLWALLALPLLLAWWRARERRGDGWRAVVDAHLLPHLLAPATGRRAVAGAVVASLAYVLAVLALAGPSWRDVERPAWQAQRPLVVAIDLSSAMLARDLPPSRIAQARAKLGALLRLRRGGQVALVAYAGDAFTVAPLTDDAANVALYLDALAPDVMPVDGQRADRAIGWSVELLRRAKFEAGDILLITGHADADARAAAARAADAGYRVSVLGIGTAAGAPYRRADGSSGHARLDAASLPALARAGRGRHATLAVDDRDLHSLGVLDPGATASAGSATTRVRQDGGYWLLPPLMLLALFAFRRRAGAALVALALCLPAAPGLAADLWRRSDQLAHQRMTQAAEAYRRGDFARAARLYREVASADAHYNRGNALAKAGQYRQAIAAYDEALRREPGMEDAVANRRAVEAALRRKSSTGGSKRDAGQGRSDARGQGGANAAARASGPPSPDTGGTPPSTRPSAPQPADAGSQQAADAAQRERMARALERGRGGGGTAESPMPPETRAQRERRLANEAWLRRVPDDPGGLLRAKFRLEYERRQQQGEAGE